MGEGQIIANRYQLGTVIGQGGMGMVYLAFDYLHQHNVALKRLRHFQDTAHKSTTDAKRSFAQEFQLLAGLQHPRILSVDDFGVDVDGHPYFTMPFLNEAQDFVTFAGGASSTETYQLLSQILEALVYVHRRGIIHRDIKPNNVLVSGDGKVYLLDFGLAITQDLLQQHQSFAGTIPYMAPEILQGLPSSYASDVWAVGAMAYQVFTGLLPRDEETPVYQTISGFLPYPDVSMFDEPLAQWMRGMLTRDVAARFDAETALQHLVDLADLVPQQQIDIQESFLQSARFVGRDDDLQALREGLTAMQEGLTVFYLVGGASGIGKSRLLEEFRIDALLSGAIVVRGESIESGGLPFHMWRSIVKQCLLHTDATDLDWAALRDLVPNLETALDVKRRSQSITRGKGYLARMIDSMMMLIVSVEEPLVILLEDLQWASESLAVLQHLLAQHQLLSHVMIVGTYRHDEAPDLPITLASMQQINLNPLTNDAVTDIAQSMLGERGIDSDVIKFLHSETEGNPYFIVESVRALADAAGHLNRVGDVALPQGLLTDGMQQLLHRRLQRMDERYLPIQQMAAAIGREIDSTVLGKQFSSEVVQQWIAIAGANAILVKQAHKMIFAHDKLRQAILHSIPTQERTRIYQQAASAIEQAYPTNDDYFELLHEQWFHAADIARAEHYLALVIPQLLNQRADYDRAIFLLQRMLDADGIGVTACSQLLVHLAHAHLLKQQYIDAKRYASDAQALAQQYALPTLEASSLSIQSKIAAAQGNHKHALELAQNGSALYDKNTMTVDYANILNDAGRAALFLGNYPLARETLLKSLEIYQRLEEGVGIAVTMNNLGLAAVHHRDYDTAQRYFLANYAIYEAEGDRRRMAEVLLNLGTIAYEQRDFEIATDYFERGLTVREIINDQQGMAQCYNNLGAIAMEREQFSEALAYHRKSLMIRQRLGDQYGQARSYLNLGMIYQQANQLEMAGQYLNLSITIYRELDLKRNLAYALNKLGFIDIARKDDRVRDHLYEAFLILQDIGVIEYLMESIVGLAWAMYLEGHSKDCVSILAYVQGVTQGEMEIDPQLTAYLSTLESSVSQEAYDAAYQHGTGLTSEIVTQQLIGYFGSN